MIQLINIEKGKYKYRDPQQTYEEAMRRKRYDECMYTLTILL